MPFAGASGVYSSQRVQRRFRDVHIAGQHIFVSPDAWKRCVPNSASASTSHFHDRIPAPDPDMATVRRKILELVHEFDMHADVTPDDVADSAEHAVRCLRKWGGWGSNPRLTGYESAALTS